MRLVLLCALSGATGYCICWAAEAYVARHKREKR